VWQVKQAKSLNFDLSLSGEREINAFYLTSIRSSSQLPTMTAIETQNNASRALRETWQRTTPTNWPFLVNKYINQINYFLKLMSPEASSNAKIKYNLK
jgi:hypothetical protein